MTITKRISAPVGSGITMFVADLAFQHAAPTGRRVIVIDRHELLQQWRRFLSAAEVSAEYMTYPKWERLPVVDPDSLIIVGAHSPSMYPRMVGPLSRCHAEVWLINEPVR